MLLPPHLSLVPMPTLGLQTEIYKVGRSGFPWLISAGKIFVQIEVN
jgi:hypothetical protein